jgi:pyridoxine kinase
MSVALILSSYVAASRVGGAAQALALSALGIDPVLVPTTLFGRHPGRGAPGGAAVSDEIFESVLGGIEADGVFTGADLLITGYFASPGQVHAAARAIDAARAVGKARIIVDPIMGDGGRLYVSEAVAEAIAGELVPRADLITPNAWELERLSGVAVEDTDAAIAAVRRLRPPVLVSSVPSGDMIGVLYADADQAWLATNPRAATAPNGTGDLLTALFAAALVEALPVEQALARAVGAVADAVAMAGESGVDELPIVAMGAGLRRPSAAVRVERVGSLASPQP